MNTAEYVTTIVCLTVFSLGTVLSLIFYLGPRIDRLGQRIGQAGRQTGGGTPPSVVNPAAVERYRRRLRGDPEPEAGAGS